MQPFQGLCHRPLGVRSDIYGSGIILNERLIDYVEFIVISAQYQLCEMPVLQTWDWLFVASPPEPLDRRRHTI